MRSLEQNALRQRIDRIFAGYAQPGSPGCAVGVQRAGEWLFSAGYGLASVEHAVPITPRTVFRIASVSKQFTVTAVLMLAAQGRLSLDDEVRTYVPELAPLPHRVSLEQLMRNTSGLPDFLEMLRLGGLGLDARLERAAMLQGIARNTHLNFQPGSRFLYCNSNFLLLGLVVERVAGCSLGEFLQRQVFAPLGMGSTTLVVAGDVPVPRLATPYLPDDKGGLRRAMHGFEHGGEGGLVSCVDDLLLWMAELNVPTRLPQDLLSRLASPTRLNAGMPSPYSCGLEHSQLMGLACIGHGGLWPGFRTELLHVGEAQLSVVVISNHGASNPYRLAREVARAVLPPPKTAVALSRPMPDLPSLAGTWLCAETPALFELAVQDGELCATQWGVPFALEPQADGRWLPLRGAYEFALSVRDAGTIEVDLGAGETARFSRLGERAPADAALVGRFACTDNAAVWDIAPASDSCAELALRVSGPHVTGASAWRLRGVTVDLVELLGPSYWMNTSQLAQLERDALGRIVGLRIFTSRIRGLHFGRV
ncbi:MAG: serine hydrolase domain-containing protein [Rubrivivax sp.]